MFCANCGKKVNISDLVCKKCGNEVELNGYIPFFDNDEPEEFEEIEKFEELAGIEKVEEVVDVPVPATSERAVGFGTVEDLVPEEDGFFVGRWFIITVIVSIGLVIGAVAAIVLFSNSLGGFVAEPEQAQTEAVDENEEEKPVSVKENDETNKI